MNIIRDNPVFRRELRLCLRLRRSRAGSGSRRFLGWDGSLLLCLIAFFYTRGLLSIWHGSPNDARDVWTGVVFVLLLAAAVLGPVLSAGAISQECEQQTWEMLAVTHLSPVQVIVGKWLGRLAPLGLLILAGTPLLLDCTLRAGFSLFRAATILFLAVVIGSISGAFGLLCSFACRKSVPATIAALAASVLFFPVPLSLGISPGVDAAWMNVVFLPMLLIVPAFCLSFMVSSYSSLTDRG